MTEKVAVLGAGSWGSVLANVLVENGHQVKLWSRNADQVQEMNQDHTNHRYLPNLTYQVGLEATTDMTAAVKDASLVLIVIPTKGLREVTHHLAQVLSASGASPVIAHATKGLEQGSYKRPSEMIQEEIAATNRQGIVVLSGPSHAEDVSIHDMTAVTAASSDEQAAKFVQGLFMNHYFRVYTNDDVIGAEFGAALKNVIAIGSGALTGLGYHDNARAALITRGLAEIRRLGVSFGANPMTFIGLSGVGDLVVTATSKNSRNWRAGYQLGQGKPLDRVVAEMGMVIEGLSTVKVAHELAQKRQVKMPITEAIYEVVYNGQDIQKVLAALMTREGTSEVE